MSLNNRYEFVYLFDVTDGNPNGDPDAGNAPRIDPDTGHGLVTDVCLKRKVRNYITLLKDDKPPYSIYIKQKAVLNQLNELAYKALEIKPEKKKLPKNTDEATGLTRWMCQNFYDIRTFGQMMATEVNCGEASGPVQLNFSRSVDPITDISHSITRMAVTNEKDMGKERTMGNKHTIPYALYRCHGYVVASNADKSGFDESDLELFFSALENMFEYDRSAARGEMSVCGIYVFKHNSKLGNAHAKKLFNTVKVERKTPDEPPRAFADYQVTVDKSAIPEGVELIVRYTE
ncbi:hypothetical protein CI610_01788 [invertebrate metagenome]|uniref:CRISPR-associated protein Csd2 n=1 Tax=invertebrate metagenome TaxID=1711999 RepID=A0A2H9T7N3_9ZZZZ